MSKYNTASRTGVRSPVITLSSFNTGPVRTAQGASGHLRDSRSELFLLAVSNMASSADDFYESAKDRDSRFVALLRDVASDTVWSQGFVKFLRGTANMRSASVVAAAEIVKARLEQGITGNRQIIDAALQRADEPGELLAYWTAKYGRNFPMPVKRGVSDAVLRLWNERGYLKWDGESKGWRFADVLQAVHPQSDREWQSKLFKLMLDARYGGEQDTQGLSIITARRALMALPVEQRRYVTAGQLAEAGMTWEALAGWLQGPLDARQWEKIIPSMGVMALLRNLRNFDQAGISKTARRTVEDVLTDPEKIASSRQLPMRFLSAYRATRDSGTVSGWAPVIEEALNLSLANVPVLPGRTLILGDVSGSMNARLSERSDLRRVDAAAVFCAAIARRAQEADLYAFDTNLYGCTAEVAKGGSVLPLAEKISQVGGGGTNTAAALQTTYAGHDRVLIVTDEQAGGSYWHGGGSVQAVMDNIKVPIYTWNLGGYQVAQAESGRNRQHTFGGLTDSSFRMVPLLEAGLHQDWGTLFA